MLKLLGLVCVGVFVSAAYYELKQVAARRRGDEPADEDPEADADAADEMTDGDRPAHN